MRINSNRKIHNLKKDPYTVLLRVTVVLVIIAVVSAGVFLVCNTAVQSDYKAKRVEIDKLNEDGEQAFNAQLNALRSNSNAVIDPQTGAVTTADLPFWEVTLDGQTWRVEDEGRADLENINTVTVDRPSLINGGLLLVNPWHPLPSDFNDSTLVGVGKNSGWKIAVTDNNVKLFPPAYEALQSMITDAGTAGLADYIVREAYRSNDTQTEFFNARMTKLSDKYSGDILIEQTKKYVNYPGTSEFQSGMSFRMDIYNKAKPEVGKQPFQESDQGKWFTQNDWKYGVIFRFQIADFPVVGAEDKSYKTGVSTQLNLYRYVGKPHAAAMRVLDYCLEEYIEFLINHPHICIYQDGALRYEVYRIEADVQDSYDLPVPNPASGYIASLDNMGGIVMGYTYAQ